MPETSEMDAAVRELALRESITREVVFFYHQQADYDFITDHVSYAPIAWWEYLALEERDEHIERGCLAMSFAAASCEAWEVGMAMHEWLGPCRDAVAAFAPSSEELARLRKSALTALALAAIPVEARDFEQVHALQWEAEWIHGVTVRRYFLSSCERWRASAPSLRG